MPVLREERNRILQMVQEGQVNAQEASQLLDALEPLQQPQPRTRERTIRIRTTQPTAMRQHVHLVATLPLNVLKTTVRLGVQLFPGLRHSTLEELLQAIEHGNSGRLLDIQDLDRGERLEIFVE